MREFYSAGERARLRSQRETVEDWNRRHMLRPELTTDSAADILWTMTSPAVHQMLVTERRWPQQYFAAWLTGQLVRELFH